MRDTRDDILCAALTLFAQDGYEAVSVSRISGALGMTKGALYRHYQSKRDIFDTLLARMETRDAERAKEFSLPEGTLSRTPEEYQKIGLDQVIAFSRAQFRYWTQDAFAAAFRRMLTLEQYKSAEMEKLYQQYLGAGPLDYVADLLTGLGEQNPREKALNFYGPMFLLFSLYDGAEDQAEALRQADEYFDRAGAALTGADKASEGEKENGYESSDHPSGKA